MRVPAKPFVDWIECELAKLDRDQTVEDPLERLAARCGTTARTLARYRRSKKSTKVKVGGRWREREVSTDSFDEFVVLEFLHNADVRFEDVYTGKPARGPDGKMVATVPESAKVCPGCGGPKTYTASSCWTCTDRHGERRRSRTYNMDEPLIREAYGLYVEGLSVRGVAKMLFGRTHYASPACFANQLYSQFKRRGWKLRNQGAATAESNRHRHDGAPRCGFVKASGRRCRRRTYKGYCWHHHPDRIAAGLARVKRNGPETAATLRRIAARQNGKPAHNSHTLARAASAASSRASAPVRT